MIGQRHFVVDIARLEGGSSHLWVFTYPAAPLDLEALALALSSRPPQAVIFDIHPQWPPRGQY